MGIAYPSEGAAETCPLVMAYPCEHQSGVSPGLRSAAPTNSAAVAAAAATAAAAAAAATSAYPPAHPPAESPALAAARAASAAAAATVASAQAAAALGMQMRPRHSPKYPPSTQLTTPQSPSTGRSPCNGWQGTAPSSKPPIAPASITSSWAAHSQQLWQGLHALHPHADEREAVWGLGGLKDGWGGRQGGGASEEEGQVREEAAGHGDDAQLSNGASAHGASGDEMPPSTRKSLAIEAISLGLDPPPIESPYPPITPPPPITSPLTPP